MCLEAGPALGFDPPERVAVTRPGDAVAWARATIPDFGWFPEVYVLFLSGERGAETLRRAAWLGPATSLDDFVAWPDFSLGYVPSGGAEGVILLVCRPGEGVEPTAGDRRIHALLGLAHDARGVPLIDVILVDGRRWSSMTGR
ncbi:MAG TPA: hypothetical protein VEG38_04250 [Acidimicrobiia bacterium]|nr:hypothetical protein [Acidimicrobiia bacterium]